MLKLLPLLRLCVCAAALLVQTPPYVRVTPGSEVTLICDITEMGGSCSQVVWLRVGQVSWMNLRETYSSQNKTVCQLQISNAALQDAGRYYCIFVNGPMLLGGAGSTLSVTDSVQQSPAVDLLLPADQHLTPPLPVPLVCVASGLEDPGRAKLDWELDGEGETLSPRTLSAGEAGVLSVRVEVPAEIWAGGTEVSCILTDGELEIRKTVSRTNRESSAFLTWSLGAVCVVLLVVTVTLSFLLSRQQRGGKRESGGRSEVSDEVAADLQYAALRFQAPGRGDVSASP
ncbi:uncharacterized protein LOC117469089 isoform X1 [Trematomus bernacchii]|uniref:uncharacterized protein LOC117469089 isoform X1 n=1 Tax=Trematomus bernacchii TaxID=40690 RepID=UPI00146C9AC9|nr:uncharacterized protein LOC117469089 isoform X1 [Trematomus bernacchii]